ncbi:MAG TPA: SDR family oxidoreductase [Ktedonobacterales bacterium]|nr:SDR family oxidoreductase [Ktedonobacterales bacterium]
MRMTRDLISLAGRRVLITGAASEIGRAVALRFVVAGADLILLDADAAGLAQTAKEVSAIAGGVLAQVVDVADKSQVDAFWKRISAGQGVPDTLINNAGATLIRDHLDADGDHLERAARGALDSMLWMSQAFVAARGKRGGVIVNISSIEALASLRDDLIPYSMGRAGAQALTRALARSYGKRGFRVNALAPGAIHTPGTQRLRDTTLRHLDMDLMKAGYHFDTNVALGRWGEADEVARAALFLASDLASYVQGSILPVDGGALTLS